MPEMGCLRQGDCDGMPEMGCLRQGDCDGMPEMILPACFGFALESFSFL